MVSKYSVSVRLLSGERLGWETSNRAMMVTSLAALAGLPSAMADNYVADAENAGDGERARLVIIERVRGGLPVGIELNQTQTETGFATC